MEKIANNCKYNIPNYEFGPHDKGDACSLGYKDRCGFPYPCYGVCKDYETAIKKITQKRGGRDNVNYNKERNAEGYSDPTVYAAVSKIDKEEQRLRRVKHTLAEICALSGYKLKGPITLIDKRSGHTVRL